MTLPPVFASKPLPGSPTTKNTGKPPTHLTSDLSNTDWAVALRACRAIELLGEKAVSLKPTMRALYDRTRHAKGDNNFFLAFSSGAYLDKLGEKTEAWDFTPGAGSFMPAKKKKGQ